MCFIAYKNTTGKTATLGQRISPEFGYKMCAFWRNEVQTHVLCGLDAFWSDPEQALGKAGSGRKRGVALTQHAAPKMLQNFGAILL